MTEEKRAQSATNDANAKSQAAQRASEEAKAHAAQNAAVHNVPPTDGGQVEVEAVVVHEGEDGALATPEDTQPVDATGAPLTTEDAQTYQSPESLEQPASSVVYAPEIRETFETDETPEEDNPLGIRRTFTDDGYVVDDYSQVNAPEENDFEAVVVEEDNDLEK
jgi:hypothetical protein